MSKFSKAVHAEWIGKSGSGHGLAGVVRREHQIVDGSVAVKSEHRAVNGVISIVELRRNFEIKNMEDFDFMWAIFQWEGSPSNPMQRALEGILMIPATTEEIAEKEFEDRVKIWRATGRITTAADFPKPSKGR